LWNASNLVSTEGVGPLQRRGPDQVGPYVDVVPQPEVMIVIVDEVDPHANEKSSYAGQYGVLYVLRTDVVLDKDVFWYTDPDGERLRWGVLAQSRWNIDHALTGFNFGVKQYRIRRGG
jgi:hypothetical protein